MMVITKVIATRTGIWDFMAVQWGMAGVLVIATVIHLIGTGTITIRFIIRIVILTAAGIVTGHTTAIMTAIMTVITMAITTTAIITRITHPIIITVHRQSRLMYITEG